MIKTITWLMVGALLLCAIPCCGSVYAWDDKDESEDVCLVFLCPVLSPNEAYYWCGGTYQGGRWPDSIAGRTATILNAPPQLDSIQAYRWMQAYPSARPRLARLYGVPEEIAELYGAKYTKPQKPWVIWY